ncbi:TPA: phage tail protein [Escherichia coli]|uniref:phage tail protein n=1 Tax=Escherichia coli TaxID=562 RepID=UPI00069982E1|nr:phage tail protein [Escherichia coli]EEV6587648.1 phage tail protein [Escherichia coli]EEY1477572.1 phage tail protein [Escherichia coli]EFE7984386.1 phage tail protein [Escherichia coli]EFF4362292.1 phage tail protein [Escherichia coli]EFF6707706.1 phage tail protein [Escherichia coli]
MAIKGMAQAMRNLDALDRRAVPRAAATTLNRVAESIIAKTASSVARELAVPRRLIRARIRLSRARADKVNAKVYINTGNLPAIKLGEARVRLSRSKRRKKGERSVTKGGGSVLIVGKRRIPNAFITRLENGRWHVMQRMPWATSSTGVDRKGRPARYRLPIEVVKTPTARPLAETFERERDRMYREKLPEQMMKAMAYQLRLVMKRKL